MRALSRETVDLIDVLVLDRRRVHVLLYELVRGDAAAMTDRRPGKVSTIEFVALLVAHAVIIVFALSWAFS